jgi:hypothetical protein
MLLVFCFACICEIINEVEEEMLLCETLPVHTTGEDISNLIDLYMAETRLERCGLWNTLT